LGFGVWGLGYEGEEWIGEEDRRGRMEMEVVRRMRKKW
jgi:hypothetical protein